MIAGHFGFAAMVKSRERQAPLWALMLACQWLDIIFIPLFIAGIEGLTPVPGLPEGYGNVIIHADYTHSLVGALALSAVFGWIGALIWGKRTGIILGCVVLSHWQLDLIVHRPDLAILPGNAGHLDRIGLGMWRSHAASMLTELALVLAGALLYWRAALAVTTAEGVPRSRAHVAGGFLLAAGVITLALSVMGM
jgi:hypothetical protein